MVIHLLIRHVIRECRRLHSGLKAFLLESPQYLIADQELIRVCHGKEFTIPLAGCARLQLLHRVRDMPTDFYHYYTYFLILEYLRLYLPASGAPFPMWSSLANIISL